MISPFSRKLETQIREVRTEQILEPIFFYCQVMWDCTQYLFVPNACRAIQGHQNRPICLIRDVIKKVLRLFSSEGLLEAQKAQGEKATHKLTEATITQQLFFALAFYFFLWANYERRLLGIACSLT